MASTELMRIRGAFGLIVLYHAFSILGQLILPNIQSLETARL